MHTPTRYKVLISKLGFKSDPFEKTNADEEEHLQDYFVEPSFYDVLLGEPLTPKSAVVFAPRGGGKTALKRRIEKNAAKYGAFPVSYNAPQVLSCALEEVDLNYHLRNVITNILLRIFFHLAENGSVNLTEESRNIMVRFAEHYFDKSQIDEVREALSTIKGVSTKTIEFWNKYSGPIGVAVNVLLKAHGLNDVELPKINERRQSLGRLPGQLPMLLKVVKDLGFSSIYILIDKVDETDKTNNAPASYEYIRPLLTNLQILETPGYAFKFFLWDLILNYYQESARPDRIPYHELDWDNDKMHSMMEERLKAFSGGNIKSLNDFLSERSAGNLDRVIIYLCAGSPRTMLRMCKSIIDQQSLIEISSIKISPDAVSKGVNVFAQKYSLEFLKGNDTAIRQIRKLRAVSFTTKHVCLKTGITPTAARAKLENWIHVGLAEKVGSLREANKPSALYSFCHPLIAYNAFRDLHPFLFVSRKLKMCAGTDDNPCGRLMIRDWDIRHMCVCQVCDREHTWAN